MQVEHSTGSSREYADFITRYNTDRPDQALGMKVPADFYTH
jgi:hypothetical protein